MVGSLNKWLSTPLHTASLNGHLSIAKELLDHGSDIHAKNKNGETPLTYACKGHHWDLALRLVDQGADLEATNIYEEKTPLIKAAEDQRWDIVEKLLNQGANFSAASNNGKTLLLHASESGNTTIVLNVLDRGAGKA